jgi:hypothetical protein
MISAKVVLVALLLPSLAYAQAPVPAAPPAALSRSLPTVFLSDNQGAETKGKLVRLDTREAVLVIDNQERRFDLANVRSIQKRGDSLKNGAIAGALVGVLAAVLAGALESCEPPQCEQTISPVALAIGGGLVYGAIGAGIDALIQGRTTLYQAPIVTAPALRSAAITLRLRW